MTGLAFASTRRHAINLEPILDRMAASAPHRGIPHLQSAPDSSAQVAALNVRHVRPDRHPATGVAIDHAGRLIVADTRLDERSALAGRLDRDPTDTIEAALVLAAFDRWGDDCADQLRGDFAFVIWDAPRGEVFAARDIFGMRPLFYAATPEHFIAASEIAQILGSGVVNRRVDERSIVAALAGRTQSPRWTPFEGVRRLRPGHVLRADADRVRTRPFWRPPPHADSHRASGAEYAAELKALFEASVRDRLTAADRPGLLLSGGIDSTSIAATAAELRRSDQALPSLATYSFGYDRFPEADERSVSGRLTETLGQANTVIAADDAFPLADATVVAPDLDGPEFLQSHVLMRHTFEQAQTDSVDLVMTGHRGDSLFGEGIFDYLGVLRARGPLATWHEMAQQAAGEQIRTRAVLKRDLLRRLPTAVWPRTRAPSLRGRLRRLAPGGTVRPPWIRLDAVAAHGLDPAAPDAVPLSSLAGDARRRRHEAIIQPSQAASAEYLERLGAQAGIGYADPWSDRRIADWVLSIPPHEIAVDGAHKWVQRESMRGTVPEFARDGSFLAHPTSFYQYGILEGASPLIESLLTTAVSAERGYVDAAELRAAYERYQTGVWPGLLEWNAFWRWATTEHWLRVHDA